jgi:hypothetical protein
LGFYFDSSQIADFRELQLDPLFTRAVILLSAVCICNIQTEVSATSYNASTWSQAIFWRNSTTWPLKDGAGRDRRGIGGPVVITDVQASTTCRFNQ